MLNLDNILIVLPAILFGIVLSLIAIPLGREVVKKGVIFLDIAIAQISVLINMFYLNIFAHSAIDKYSMQALVLFSTIAISLIFYFIEKKSYVDKKYLEPIIGIAYIFSATLATLLLSFNHNSGDAIENIFSGKLLFLTYQELFEISLIYLVLFALIYYNKLQNNLLFYIIFATTISLAMPIVGIYFMFVILIIPALLFINSTKPYFYGAIFSVIAIFIGTLYSLIKDFPSGLIIVVSYIFCSIVYLSIYKILNLKQY
jgi:zinc/manganese transport system permease protein